MMPELAQRMRPSPNPRRCPFRLQPAEMEHPSCDEIVERLKNGALEHHRNDDKIDEAHLDFVG